MSDYRVQQVQQALGRLTQPPPSEPVALWGELVFNIWIYFLLVLVLFPRTKVAD
jgi:hypothetical protein